MEDFLDVLKRNHHAASVYAYGDFRYGGNNTIERGTSCGFRAMRSLPLRRRWRAGMGIFCTCTTPGADGTMSRAESNHTNQHSAHLGLGRDEGERFKFKCKDQQVEENKEAYPGWQGGFPDGWKWRIPSNALGRHVVAEGTTAALERC